MRLEPENGCVLYFPLLDDDKVVREPKYVSIFDSKAKRRFMQVEFGDFKLPVDFLKKEGTLPLRTLDNFICQFKLLVYVNIGISPEQLELVTQNFQPTKFGTKIFHQNFIKLLQGKIEAKIVSMISKMSSADLSRALNNDIEQAVENTVKKEGFTFVGCIKDILPFEFDQELLKVDPVLRKIWVDSQELHLKNLTEDKEREIKKTKVTNDAEIAKKKLDEEKKVRIAELEDETEKKKAINTVKSQSEIAAESHKQQKANEKKQFIENQAYEQFVYEQYKIRDADRLADEIANGENQKEKHRLALETEEHADQINRKHIDREKLKVQAEIELIKERNQAMNAYRASLLKELPKLFEGLKTTFPQIKDPRIFYMGTNQPGGESKGDAQLTSLMTSLSSWPLLKELLALLGEQEISPYNENFSLSGKNAESSKKEGW